MKCVFCDQEKRAWSITVTDDLGSTGICRECVGFLAEDKPSGIKARGDQFVWRLVEALKKLNAQEYIPPPLVPGSQFAISEIASTVDLAISVTTDKGKE